MSQALTTTNGTNDLEVIDEEFKRIGERAEAYHISSENGFTNHFGNAFLSGHELHHMQAAAERKGLPTKGRNSVLGKLRSKYCGKIPERTAQEYLLFYRKIINAASLAAFMPQNLLSNGTISAEATPKLREAIKEAMDGKGITQFYRGTDKVRQPKPPKGTGRKAKFDVGDGESDGGSFLTELRQDLLLLCLEEDRTLLESDTATLIKFREVHRAVGQKLDAVLKRRKNRD